MTSSAKSDNATTTGAPLQAIHAAPHSRRQAVLHFPCLDRPCASKGLTRAVWGLWAGCRSHLFPFSSVLGRRVRVILFVTDEKHIRMLLPTKTFVAGHGERVEQACLEQRERSSTSGRTSTRSLCCSLEPCARHRTAKGDWPLSGDPPPHFSTQVLLWARGRAHGSRRRGGSFTAVCGRRASGVRLVAVSRRTRDQAGYRDAARTGTWRTSAVPTASTAVCDGRAWNSTGQLQPVKTSRGRDAFLRLVFDGLPLAIASLRLVPQLRGVVVCDAD